MIKAIIFDFDGLIIDTESAWYDALVHIFSEYNVTLPFDTWVKCVGASHAVFDPYIYFTEQYGKAINIEMIKEKVNAQHTVIMSTRGLRDGVLSYMEEAKQAGYKIGIASSSHLSWIVPYLEKFDLKHYIEVIRCADYVKNVKPDPEVYLLAMQELGVEPEEVIAFEDSPNGAKAAFRAGVNVVTVPNIVTEKLEFGPHLIRMQAMTDMSLAEVVERVLQIRKLPLV